MDELIRETMNHLIRRTYRTRKFAPLLPGVFTVGNIFCGFVSILHSTSGKFTSGAWLIILGALFDLLDGKVARMMRGSSEMGMQFDSFADFLTFGVAPGILLFSLEVYSFRNWGFIIPLLFLLTGTFRLARYNVTADPHRKADFQGLPIPLAATFVAGFVIFVYDVFGEMKFTQFFTPSIVLLSWLMISNVGYSAFPKLGAIKKLRWKVAVLSVPIGAILLKPKWFIFPTVFIYILHGFFREIFWMVRRNEKEVSNEKV